MKTKRDLITGKILKFIARLNVHRGKQIYGMDYFELYSPVAIWVVIMFIMIVIIMLE